MNFLKPKATVSGPCAHRIQMYFQRFDEPICNEKRDAVLGGGVKDFLFLPIPGEDSHFD